MDVWILDRVKGFAFSYNGSQQCNVHNLQISSVGFDVLGQEIDIFSMSNKPHTIEQLINHCEAYVEEE